MVWTRLCPKARNSGILAVDINDIFACALQSPFAMVCLFAVGPAQDQGDRSTGQTARAEIPANGAHTLRTVKLISRCQQAAGNECSSCEDKWKFKKEIKKLTKSE